ncbi:unnamed protein product, partial [Prorocentrum cordatum]
RPVSRAARSSRRGGGARLLAARRRRQFGGSGAGLKALVACSLGVNSLLLARWWRNSATDSATDHLLAKLEAVTELVPGLSVTDMHVAGVAAWPANGSQAGLGANSAAAAPARALAESGITSIRSAGSDKTVDLVDLQTANRVSSLQVLGEANGRHKSAAHPARWAQGALCMTCRYQCRTHARLVQHLQATQSCVVPWMTAVPALNGDETEDNREDYQRESLRNPTDVDAAVDVALAGVWGRGENGEVAGGGRVANYQWENADMCVDFNAPLHCDIHFGRRRERPADPGAASSHPPSAGECAFAALGVEPELAPTIAEGGWMNALYHDRCAVAYLGQTNGRRERGAAGRAADGIQSFSDVNRTEPDVPDTAGHWMAPVAALPWARAKELAGNDLAWLLPPQTGPDGADMINLEHLHRIPAVQVYKRADLQEAERKVSHSKSHQRASYLLHVANENSSLHEPSEELPPLLCPAEALASKGGRAMRPCSDNLIFAQKNLDFTPRTRAGLRAPDGGPHGGPVSLVDANDEEPHNL